MAADVRGRSLRALPALPLVLFLVAMLAWPLLRAVGLALTDGPSGAFPSGENLRVLAADPLFRRALLGNVVVPAASVALELVAGRPPTL